MSTISILTTSQTDINTWFTPQDSVARLLLVLLKTCSLWDQPAVQATSCYFIMAMAIFTEIKRAQETLVFQMTTSDTVVSL